MTKKVAVVLAVILVFLLFMYGNAGGFSKVTVIERSLAPTHIAVVHLQNSELQAKGDKKSTKLSNLNKTLTKLGIGKQNESQFMTISYEDRSKENIKTTDLLSGIIISANEAATLKEKHSEITILEVDSIPAYTSTLKHRGVISITLAIAKQRKKMLSYAKDNNAPTVSIVDFKNNTVTYAQPKNETAAYFLKLLEDVKKMSTAPTTITPPEANIQADSTEA